MKMFAVDPRHTAMAVTHVFAKTNIGDRDQTRTFLFGTPQRYLNDAILRVSAACLFVFIVGNSKKQYSLKSGVLRLLGLSGNFIDCELKNSGHARNRSALVDFVAHEKRQNEIVSGKV